MPFRIVVSFSLLISLSSLRANAETVTFSLTSEDAGVVSPGQVVDWQISAEITSGGSAGLALVAIDLIQDELNPELFNLPPANGVPVGLEGYSRPAGISNPGEGGATTGYIGVQRGAPGAMNLHQIGGAQNSTGAAGATIGQDINLEANVGFTGPVVIAQGSFVAPNTNGTYTFQLENAIANTFDSVSAPGTFSPVSPADVVFGSGSFQIVVSTGSNIGDINCDGVINTADIQHFVQALVAPAAYVDDHDGSPFPTCDLNMADVNQDTFADGGDITGFVSLLLGS